jgi:steroid 5-alpha reductase family enzyme
MEHFTGDMSLLDLQAIYQYGIIAVLILALVIIVALFFIRAPYGRYKRTNRGLSLTPRIGWVLMELPSVIGFAWIYFQGGSAYQLVTLMLFCMWELHYVQRTFIYTLLMRSSATPIPLSVVVMGWIFNVTNASLNAIALTHLSPRYPDLWFIDPRFLIGVVIFLTGFVINLHSDHILRNLRKRGDTGYKIPYGGLFRWITCPNYFGEIVVWCGWAISSWSLAGAAFALFTFANLVPRAWAHHKWYYTNFSDYPKNRKAVIPGIL